MDDLETKLGIAAIWGWLPDENQGGLPWTERPLIRLWRDSDFLIVFTDVSLEEWAGIFIGRNKFPSLGHQLSDVTIGF